MNVDPVRRRPKDAALLGSRPFLWQAKADEGDGVGVALNCFGDVFTFDDAVDRADDEERMREIRYHAGADLGEGRWLKFPHDMRSCDAPNVYLRNANVAGTDHSMQLSLVT